MTLSTETFILFVMKYKTNDKREICREEEKDMGNLESYTKRHNKNQTK